MSLQAGILSYKTYKNIFYNFIMISQCICKIFKQFSDKQTAKLILKSHSYFLNFTGFLVVQHWHQVSSSDTVLILILFLDFFLLLDVAISQTFLAPNLKRICKDKFSMLSVVVAGFGIQRLKCWGRSQKQEEESKIPTTRVIMVT